MAGTLRPCGTLAAARRHQRHGERLCTACLDVVRVVKAERRAELRAEAAARARAARPAPDAPTDRQTVLLEVLGVLRRHLPSAPAGSAAGIAREVRETVAALEKHQRGW